MPVLNLLSSLRYVLAIAVLTTSFPVVAQNRELPVKPDLRTYDGRTFLLCVVNETGSDITFEVHPGGCYEGEARGVYSMKKGGAGYMWLARVQGNDCDGEDGYFTISLKGKFRDEKQDFGFSNDSGLWTAKIKSKHFRDELTFGRPQGLPAFADARYTYRIKDPVDAFRVDGAVPREGNLVLFAGKPVTLQYEGLDPTLRCRVAVEPRKKGDAEGEHKLIDPQNDGDKNDPTKGAVTFHGREFSPGDYEARLYVDYVNPSSLVDVRVPFTIAPSPTVAVSESRVRVGQPIAVQFHNLPAGQIAVVALSESGSGPDAFVRKMPIVDETDGSLDFPQVPAGRYEARLFLGKGPGGGLRPIASAVFEVGDKGVTATDPVTPPKPAAPKQKPFIEGGLLAPTVNTSSTESTFTFEGILRNAEGLEATLECTFEIWMPQGGWQTLSAAQGERKYRNETTGGVKTSADFKVGSDSYDLAAHNLKIPHLNLLTFKRGQQQRLRARAMLLLPATTPVIAPTAEFTVTY